MDLEKLNNYNKIEETIGSTTVTIGNNGKTKKVMKSRDWEWREKKKLKEFQEAITKNEKKGKNWTAI